jgi:hypothetical protein
MKITIGRMSWKRPDIAALLLIGGRDCAGRARPGDVGSVAPTVGIPCDELVVARC